MRIAVGIPTLGRNELLNSVIARLNLQSRKADAVFICPVSDSDVENIEFDGEYLIRVESEKGSSKQRNAIFDKIHDFDLVIFFDDDFVPHNDYIKHIEQEFKQSPQTVIATGNVIADGACNEGISFEDAVKQADKFNVPENIRKEIFSSYGCNMAMRLTTIYDNKLRFDEDLPLYAWLEDLDLTVRMVKYGQSIQISNACGVHMGYKIGRITDIQYGYSQIANTLHIAKKGNGFSYFMAISTCIKKIIANAVKSFFPEPYISRTCRLKGNMIAIKDLLLGKLDTKKIEKL